LPHNTPPAGAPGAAVATVAAHRHQVAANATVTVTEPSPPTVTAPLRRCAGVAGKVTVTEPSPPPLRRCAGVAGVGIAGVDATVAAVTITVTVTYHRQTMLTGASVVQLDDKGRLAIPSRYREALAERCGGQLVTTVGFALGPARDERSLWMYPRDAWKRVAKKVAALPDFDPNHRVFKRFFIGYAGDMEMDRNGRVLLPQLLRDFAAIDKRAYLIGQSNKFELWSEEKWRARHDQWLADALDMDKISPELEQLSL